jgi:hypothetical protein
LAPAVALFETRDAVLSLVAACGGGAFHV